MEEQILSGDIQEKPKKRKETEKRISFVQIWCNCLSGNSGNYFCVLSFSFEKY